MQSKTSRDEDQGVLDQLLPKWLAGEIDHEALPEHYPNHLRINTKNRTVETSRGYDVDLEHAKSVLPKVIAAINGNTRLDFDVADQHGVFVPGEPEHTVVVPATQPYFAVGCTQFRIEQVMELAKQLNITAAPAPDTAKV